MKEQLETRINILAAGYLDNPARGRRAMRLAARLVDVNPAELADYVLSNDGTCLSSPGLAQSLRYMKGGVVKEFRGRFAGAYITATKETIPDDVRFVGSFAGHGASFNGKYVAPNATFSGEFAGRKASFTGELAGYEATFEGGQSGEGAFFEGILAGYKASFEGYAAGMSTWFKGEGAGSHVSFDGERAGQGAARNYKFINSREELF